MLKGKSKGSTIDISNRYNPLRPEQFVLTIIHEKGTGFSSPVMTEEEAIEEAERICGKVEWIRED
jgi:hypothetical protein